MAITESCDVPNAGPYTRVRVSHFLYAADLRPEPPPTWMRKPEGPCRQPVQGGDPARDTRRRDGTAGSSVQNGR